MNTNSMGKFESGYIRKPFGHCFKWLNSTLQFPICFIRNTVLQKVRVSSRLCRGNSDVLVKLSNSVCLEKGEQAKPLPQQSASF